MASTEDVHRIDSVGTPSEEGEALKDCDAGVAKVEMEEVKGGGGGETLPVSLHPTSIPHFTFPSDKIDLDTLDKASKGWNGTKKMLDFWFDSSSIKGEIPKELHGTFLRNGPGLSDVYGTPLKHPIDGDGMVCAVTFINGKAHFRSRFVDTKSHKAEAEKKQVLYRGQMGLDPKGVVGNLVTCATAAVQMKRPHFKYRNPSNTNVFFWGGKVITCYETGIPHAMNPYTLETIGPETFDGALDLGAFAAHFRYDADCDRLVGMSLRPGVGEPARLNIYEFDRSWKVVHDRKLRIDGLNYAHDFLLTSKYYIFHMSPFVKLSKGLILKILAGLTSPGDAMQYYPDLPSRIVLIPRNGSGDIIQLDTEPCHIFHFGNVTELPSGEICFNAVCLGEKFTMDFQHRVWLSNANVEPGMLYEYRVNKDKTEIKRTLCDPCSCEFPSVHPYRHVCPAGPLSPRFVYLMANDRGARVPYTDIVKYDAQMKRRQRWAANGIVGEPVFVPRSGASSARKGAEDDGWVLVQMYDYDAHRTEFIILDAMKLDAGPVARLVMPCHVTYGFHGTFTPEVFVTPRPSL